MVPEGTDLAVGFYNCFKSISNVIKLFKIPFLHRRSSGEMAERSISYSEIAFEAV